MSEIMSILNLGCGSNPIKGNKNQVVFNMDAYVSNNFKDVIICHNLLKFPYPFVDETMDKVYLFHTIEHIPEEKHYRLLQEIRRVLKPTGRAYISYPEFIKCANNYINNKNGQREFWKATVYGRGLTRWDRHCALMNTSEFVQLLAQVGFKNIKAKPERMEDFNTIVTCQKGDLPITYEELMRREFDNQNSGGTG